MKTFPIIIFLFCLTITCSPQTKVDLIVYHAQIYTVDSAFSMAQAFAVKDGKFIAIGSDEEIQRKYKAIEKIDAQGKAIYPGFYDAHAHLFDEAELMDQVDLNGSDSFEEVIQRVKNYQQKNPDKT